MPRILAFSGSARSQSFNQRLVAIAATGAEQAGAEVKLISLADYPMPIFNQDLERTQGLPDEARAFKQLLVESDGFLISSPEYNSAFSPLLKNALDWASRSETEEEQPLLAYRGKVAVIMATSPGSLGGLRGLVFLRMLLNNLAINVLPGQQAIPAAASAFSQNGTLRDKNQQQAVLNLGTTLFQTLNKLMD